MVFNCYSNIHIVILTSNMIKIFYNSHILPTKGRYKYWLPKQHEINETSHSNCLLERFCLDWNFTVKHKNQSEWVIILFYYTPLTQTLIHTHTHTHTHILSLLFSYLHFLPPSLKNYWTPPPPDNHTSRAELHPGYPPSYTYTHYDII